VYDQHDSISKATHVDCCNDMTHIHTHAHTRGICMSQLTCCPSSECSCWHLSTQPSAKAANPEAATSVFRPVPKSSTVAWLWLPWLQLMNLAGQWAAPKGTHTTEPCHQTVLTPSTTVYLVRCSIVCNVRQLGDACLADLQGVQ